MPAARQLLQVRGGALTGTPAQSYSITQALVNAGLLPQSSLIPNLAAGEAPTPDQLCSAAVIGGSSNPTEMQTLCNEYQGGENITLGIANYNASQVAEGASQLPGNLVNLVDDSSPTLPSIPTWVWLVGGGLAVLLAYAAIKNLA